MIGLKQLAAAGVLCAATGIFATSAEASICYNINALSFSDAGTTCSDIDVGALNGTPSYSGTPGSAFGPTAVAGAVGGTGNNASAAASAGFGALHVYGSSHYDPGNDFNTAHGNAYASFTDEIVVGPGGATLLFTSTLEGSLTISAQANSLVRLYDSLGGADLTGIAGYLGYNSSTQTYTRELTLAAGHTYLLYSAVEVLVDTVSPSFTHGARDAIGDLSNTSKLNIDVEQGSFTTLSDHDYSTDAVASDVPEPASWALFIGGFGLAGGAMRSRRKVAVSFG